MGGACIEGGAGVEDGGGWLIGEDMAKKIAIDVISWGEGILDAAVASGGQFGGALRFRGATKSLSSANSAVMTSNLI